MKIPARNGSFRRRERALLVAQHVEDALLLVKVPKGLLGRGNAGPIGIQIDSAPVVIPFGLLLGKVSGGVGLIYLPGRAVCGG